MRNVRKFLPSQGVEIGNSRKFSSGQGGGKENKVFCNKGTRNGFISDVDHLRTNRYRTGRSYPITDHSHRPPHPGISTPLNSPFPNPIIPKTSSYLYLGSHTLYLSVSPHIPFLLAINKHSFITFRIPCRRPSETHSKEKEEIRIGQAFSG